MRLKKGAVFYRLPYNVREVIGVRVKIEGDWHYLRHMDTGDTPPRYGKPYMWRFHAAHLEIHPAPKKAYFAAVDVNQRVTL